MNANTSVMGGNARGSNPGSTSNSVTLSKLVHKPHRFTGINGDGCVGAGGGEGRLGPFFFDFSANFNSFHVLRLVCIQCDFC